MYKVLIADDERLARKRINELLRNYAEFTVISEVATTNEVISEMQNADVLFIDINMPGLDIFTLLKDTECNALIVFQTAYQEFALSAFEVGAADYLLKPVSRERFSECMRRLLTLLAKRTQERSSFTPYITVKQGESTRVIAKNDIQLITLHNGIAHITLRDGTVTYSDRAISWFLEKLNNEVFIQVSRTAVINSEYIGIIHNEGSGLCTAELKSGIQVAVSRRRVSALKLLFGDV